MIPRDHEEPMSFWEWVRTQLLLFVPLLNLVLLIYWACSDRGKASRRNFARAYLAIVGSVVAAVFILAAASVPLARKVRDASVAKIEALKTKRAEPAEAENPPAAGSANAPSAKPATLTPDEPPRGFRSTDGRTIEARVVSLTDEQVTIRRADGREFTTEMSRFSPEDVAYFMRLRHGGGAFD